MSQDCEDDYTMTAAEADALRGPRNLPKIPVRSLPERLHSGMVSTTIYKILIERTSGDFALMHFNGLPSHEQIISALQDEKDESVRAGDQEPEVRRLTGVLALVTLAVSLLPTIFCPQNVPRTGTCLNHDVILADKVVGHITIQPIRAWNVPDHFRHQVAGQHFPEPKAL